MMGSKSKSFGGKGAEAYSRGSAHVDSNSPNYRLRRRSYLSQIPAYASYAFSPQEEQQFNYHHPHLREEEEEDVEFIKREIHQIKKKTLESTENSLRVAEQAENTGTNTLTRLNEQGEKLHQTHQSLRRAVGHSVTNERRLKDLKIANRSLFMPHFEISNPFTSHLRAEREEQAALERYRLEREERVKAYLDQRRNQRAVQAGLYASELERERNARANAPQWESDWSRGMYSFEADEEDDRMERDINGNLEQLSVATGNLRRLADTIHRVVDSQSNTITAINDQALKIEQHTARNAFKLQRVGTK